MPHYSPGLHGHMMNMTGISEHSQGGITSKRSHKYLFDSGQPCLSKQDTEIEEEEPADPMLENIPQQHNRIKHQPYSMVNPA